MSGPFPTIESEAGGSFTYFEGDQKRRLGVDLIPRGHYRRSVCSDFPPFKIQFSRRAMEGTVFFGGADEYKYVTQCKSPREQGAVDALYMEYTLYRILNATGLPAFLVRLVDAVYLDPTESRVMDAGPGFLIENFKDLVQRRGYRGDERPNDERIKTRILISHIIAQNVDFNPSMGQNAKAVRNKSGDVIDYVAYDFDQSNLIVGETFFKNIGVDWDDDHRLEELFRIFPGPVKETLELVLRHEGRVSMEIQSSPVDPENRQRFVERMGRFFAAARRIIAK